ncbi:ATP-binding protein [Streptomyces sp. NPDC056405]|uniref:ATP-binding protein n=1 Tax=Streptomyces sp. NPDC056405 TaxID=3345811 RepID=UPI0035DB89C5
MTINSLTLPESRVAQSNSWVFSRDTMIPSLARRRVADLLKQWSLTGCVDDVTLVASELITNAVIHGHGGIRLEVRLLMPAAMGKVVHVEVTDGGRGLAPGVFGRVPRPTEEAESGRGLDLVAAVALRTGSVSEAGRNTVWAWIEARSQ